ncbi:hypothetical protein B0H14DRAFT_2576797 [Mycena olivaceomarginata]|nr:hypothetical protein B0H14DRAFT_2576797 [Mycena olivaceomarginata]
MPNLIHFQIQFMLSAKQEWHKTDGLRLRGVLLDDLRSLRWRGMGGGDHYIVEQSCPRGSQTIYTHCPGDRRPSHIDRLKAMRAVRKLAAAAPVTPTGPTGGSAAAAAIVVGSAA